MNIVPAPADTFHYDPAPFAVGGKTPSGVSRYRALDPDDPREFAKSRFERGTLNAERKTFVWHHRPAGGAWRRGLDGVPQGALAPYGLPAPGEKLPDDMLWVVEGEGVADALRAQGFFAVTFPGGAGTPPSPAQVAALSNDREAVVLPDADDQGRAHARRIAELLVARPGSHFVILVDPPFYRDLPVPPGKTSVDIADWIAAGGSAAALREAVLQYEPFAIPAATPGPASAVSVPATARAGVDEADGEPDEAMALPDFPLDVLPPFVAELARAFAASAAAPVEMSAVPMLAAAAAALGPTWEASAGGMTRPARLWFAVVAPPGAGKSPAARPALAPLHTADAHFGREYERHRAEFERAEDERTAEKRRSRGRKTPPSGRDAETPPHLRLLGPDDAPPIVPPPTNIPPPRRRRFCVTDATIEGLARILEGGRDHEGRPLGRPAHDTATLGGGNLLLHLDEIAGLLGDFDRYKSKGGSGRPFYLALWSGERYASARKTAEESEIEHPHCVLFGGTQPARIRALELAVNDGLCVRFLWSWPRCMAHGLGADLDPLAAEAWADILAPALVDRLPEARLPFDGEALTFLDARTREWSGRAVELDAAGAGLTAAVFGKAPDHLVRLAALLAGLDFLALPSTAGAPPPLPLNISRAMVERADRLLAYFIAHSLHTASFVTARSHDDGDLAEGDRDLAATLRGLPGDGPITETPAGWARRLEGVGLTITPRALGHALARLSARADCGLTIMRPPRGDQRAWTITRNGGAE